MKKLFVALGGLLSFGLLFIVMNNVTGMISRSLVLSRPLDDALFIGGILLAALGSGIFMWTVWRRNRGTN
jgi:hypothetical protein